MLVCKNLFQLGEKFLRNCQVFFSSPMTISKKTVTSRNRNCSVFFEEILAHLAIELRTALPSITAQAE